MIIKQLKEVEVEVSYIRLMLPARFGTEDIPNDFPLRQGEIWCADIAIESGCVLGWPKGQSRYMHMKVCEGGCLACN